MNSRRLYFHTSLVGASTALMMAFNALKVLYVARVTPLDIIGEFAVYMSVFGVFKLMSSGGLSGTLVHLHHLSKDLFAKILWRGGVVASLVSVLIVLSLLGYESELLSLEVILTLCLFPLLSISALFRVLLDRNESLIEYNVAKIIGGIVNLLVTMLLLRFNLSLSSLVIGLLSQELLISVVIIYRGIIEMQKLNSTTDESDFTWKKGLNNLLATGINYVGREVDIYAFKLFYNIEILGSYFVLKSLVAKPMTVIASVLTSVGAHRLRKLTVIKDRIVRLYIGYLALIVIIYSLLFIGFYFFKDFIYNGKYSFGFNLILLVITMNFFRSAMVPFGTLILSSGEFLRGLLWNILVSFILILVTLFFCANYSLESVLLSRSILFLLLFIIGIRLVVVPCINLLQKNE
jgi:O-antigen/teichoic acid export membrane protein